MDNSYTYFIYNLNSNTLINAHSRKHLIYIRGETFLELEKKFTSKFELNEHVHIFEESTEYLLKIEFPRMKLNFYLDKEFKILSKEYRGFQVSPDQNIGTLIGLKRVIVLCESDNIYDDKPRTQIIVPHGELEIEIKSKTSKTVDVVYEPPRSPPIFTYEIDWRLHRLKASESIEAWLYLAWLHATTSQVLADPFLKMTGTEISLEILQSGYCWSSLPLSVEAKYILEKIAKLSPKREFYPRYKKVMQQVSWMTEIPSMNAHEGFAFITEKLLCDNESERNSTKTFLLESRAINKAEKCQNSLGQLKADFRLFIKNDKAKNVTRSIDYKDDAIKNLRNYKNGYLTNLNKQSSFNLVDFIFSTEIDQLTFNFKRDLRENISINEWLKIARNLRENWIILYEFSLKYSFENSLKLKFILSLIAYENQDIPLEMLLFFNLVNDNNEYFKGILIPEIYAEYTDIHSDRMQSILSILERNFVNISLFDVYHVFQRFDYSTIKSEKLQLAKNIITRHVGNKFGIEELKRGNNNIY
jgi:hypothetical protein